MIEFFCSKCKVFFKIREDIINIKEMCFIEHFGGGGIHCPCCRDNNLVGILGE